MSSSLTSEPSSSEPAAWVVCLCAEWCGLCRDYQGLFAQMATRYPLFRFVWLDVEDQADLAGDMDVETFPTLLLADAQGLRFLGPLTPQANTLSRLLDSLQDDGLRRAAHSPESAQLLASLQATPEHWLDASNAA